MRFKFPDKELMKTLYSITKKIYKNDIYDFFDNIKQKIFYINSSTINVVVVIDPISRRLNVFYNGDGYITCHNLFAGDAIGLYNYGFTMLSVEEVNVDSNTHSGLETFLTKYKHHKTKDKTVCYISVKKGQLECVIDEKEAAILIETLSYLLNIKNFFENGYEEVDTEEEMVGVFEFDDENYTYTSSYAMLENFNFLPKDLGKERKSKYVLESIKSLNVKSGTLYIGQIYGNFPYEYFECSNKMAIALAPIVLYAASDDKVMEYVVCSSTYNDINKTLRDKTIELLSKTGLYDTIVTDNLDLYCLLSKSLKTIGIEMNFSVLNPYNVFLTKYIGKMCSYKMDSEIFLDLMEEVKRGFITLNLEEITEQELMEIVEPVIFDEEDELLKFLDEESEKEYSDEEDDKFFNDTSSSDIVC